MLKEILKLEGAQKLSKKKQTTVNGGFGNVVISCFGEPDGTPCLGNGRIVSCIQGYCDC